MSKQNKFSVFMSAGLALCFGFVWGVLLALVNVALGIVLGSVFGFACFYGLIRQTWEKTPKLYGRRFDDVKP